MKIAPGQTYKFTNGPYKFTNGPENGTIIKIMCKSKEGKKLGIQDVWEVNIKDANGNWIQPEKNLVFGQQIIAHCKPYIKLKV